MPRESSRVSQRRKFKVQSEFGNARGWRSRKNRPCDVCRRRKTACVITSTPPCLFCKERGLECKSSTPAAAASVATASITASLSGLADERTIGLVSELIPSEGGPGNPFNVGVEEVHAIVRTPDVSDRPVTGSVAFTGHAPPSPNAANHVEGRYDQDASDPSAAFRPDDTETWSLEDKENRTAHSMGPAAEQDTHLLASFRSDILSGPTEIDAEFVQVYEGSQYPWDPPVHFCILQDEFAAHDDEVKAAASRSIEDLVEPHGPLLVKLYFRHVHPVFPILSKARFLRQYSGNKTKLPASLRGAVYALASVFWESEPSSDGPFSFQQHELADLAADSLQRELDSPNLAKLQASLLLLHMMPNKVDSIAHPKTWTSTAQAVASAQMIGLHQDAEKWNIPKCEKRLRRKLWWATYVTDVWSAICHGNPPHIYPASFNTSNTTMEDLRNDETVPEELRQLVDPSCAGFDLATGARFLELVKLSQALHELIDYSL
ncbi:putative transcriptional regulatory protein C25B8.11 [Colletotrichum liriopes]|uniref:Transcriptional regulatory protein C25B8.11 n=1 Tax=Colletotrichum liriopes TaxID=708192 RepID=A0AA37LZU1_9PEZI|nr:putative transcriptional regulatory protein C25B8.11 [Colletotrichum liriopes]